jgi:enoyl-CoA hydratase
MQEPVAPDPSVIARRDRRIGRIVMNRPRALNALDLDMIRGIAAALEAWRDDPAVHAVVIEAAGDRAFCAGGDIRAIRRHALAGESGEIETFFREEYALNLLIARFPKPYIALIDGLCLGGGIGVSVHGTARVVTEHAVLAMPETAIGFFPDVGATFFLPRLPGQLGAYLGLTGARLQGADAVHAGLATHFVPRDTIAALTEALAEDGMAALGAATLARSAAPGFSQAPHRAAIDRCFAAPDLAGILGRLAAEETAWSRTALDTLRQMSPSALAWSLTAIRAGATRDLRACLEAELALTRHATRHPDFAEGVRAMVVDKDRTPRWTPASIEQLAG